MRIAVIEDERPIREGLVHILNKISPEYQVVGSAENGREGLILLEEQDPDLILLVSSARTCRYHTQTTSAATAAIERNITYAGFIRIAFLRFFKICLSSFFFLCSFLGSSCRCGMTSAWRTVFPYMYIPRLVTVRLSACIL